MFRYFLHPSCGDKLVWESLSGQEVASPPHAQITTATTDNEQGHKCDLWHLGLQCGAVRNNDDLSNCQHILCKTEKPLFCKSCNGIAM